MTRSFKRFVIFVFLLAFTCSSPLAPANPIGDFFKRVGNSISKFRKPTPTPPPRKPAKGESRGEPKSTKGSSAPGPTPPPPPAPSPTPVDIRPATLAPPSSRKRDVPYGVAVPHRPGLVTSPYAPDQGYVDVHAFASSTEVLDPFTGKIFRTP